MEGVIGWIQQSIDSNQMIAPVLFIAFHIIRPFYLFRLHSYA